MEARAYCPMRRLALFLRVVLIAHVPMLRGHGHGRTLVRLGHTVLWLIFVVLFVLVRVPRRGLLALGLAALTQVQDTGKLA